MRLDDLKNKILQLAIQGKLIEQCNDDIPASVLLEEIKTKKEKLIEANVIKKEKPLPEIAEEERVFKLPKGWVWCRLGELFNIVRGSSPRPKGHPKYFSEDKTEYNWVTIKDITQFSEENYLSQTNEYLTYEGSLKSRFIEKGEIIIAVSGSIGKTVIMGIDGYIYDGLAGLKNIIDNNCFRDYIYFVLVTWKQNLNNMSEGTSIQNINTEKLNFISIALPPLQEQKRIVEKVNELFKLIDELNNNKEAMLKNISNSRNKLLKLAMQGKLVEQCEDDKPAKELLEEIRVEKEKLIKEKIIKKEKSLPEITEEEKSFDIPKGWEWCRLGEVVQINPRNKAEDEIEVSFIPMSLINDGYNSNHDSEVRAWKEVKSGFTHFAENDVVVAKITPCFENRKSAIMKNLKNGIGAGTTELYVFRPYKKLILPEFIFRLVTSKEFIEGGKSTYTGTAGQQRVKKEFIENYVLGVPPLSEQKRIVEKVDMLMVYFDALQEEIESQNISTIINF